MVKWRESTKNDKQDLIDNLTPDCRTLLNSTFYDPDKNKNLKYNKIFFYEGKELDKVLKSTTTFGFDPTFAWPSSDGVQLGILVAICSDSDPTRTSSSYPILFSAMANQKTETYREFWRFCKESFLNSHQSHSGSTDAES